MSSLKDVAARAGVSISTVRYALYDLGPVRDATRQRVLDAARELDYAPNPYARALVGAKAPLIALVVPQLVWYATNVLVVTLHQQIAALGLRTAFFVSGAGPVSQTVREIGQLAPQAVLLVQVNWDDAYRALPETGTHLLALDLRPGLPEDVPADHTALDRAGAFRSITEHLLSLGHTRLALLRSPGALGRSAGYTEALQAAGVDFRAIAIAGSPSQQAPSLADCLANLLDRHPDLTGLICSTDLWAQEVVHRLTARSLKVPGDLSVAGYSNEPWTAWTTPALTTLDQGTQRLCDHTRDLLTRRLHGSREPWSREVILPQLVVRASTAPPRAFYRQQSADR